MLKENKINSKVKNPTKKASIIESDQLGDDDQVKFLKDNYDETVKQFVLKWQNLCEEYGYDEIMKLEFYMANHPFSEPAFPIEIMKDEHYMTSHYVSIAEWKNNPKPPLKFQVIELRESCVIAGIHISGPLYEYPLFQALVDICIYTRTLTVLRLIGCSLKKESVLLLGECLPRSYVTHLYLDRNPVPDEDYSPLLANNPKLVHLSLSMCMIGIRGMKSLSKVMGTYEGMEPNQRLKSLILDNNRVESFAMKSFSECLRWNRDLAFLSLAGNMIGNKGVEYLSKSFYFAEMTNREIYTMNCRQIDRLKELEDIVNEELQLPVVEISNPGEDPFEEESGYYKKLKNHNIATGMIDPIRMTIIQQTCDEFLETDPNPLSTDVLLHKGKLMGTGNYTLNSLNLSYNKIEESGFLHLLKVLRDQRAADTIRGIPWKKCYLKIIEFLGNPCPEDSTVLKKITFYLKLSRQKRDPKHIRSCTCMPILRPNVDKETLLLYDSQAEHFDPTESTAEEMEEFSTFIIEGLKGCNEMLETEEESSTKEEEREEEGEAEHVEEVWSKESNDDTDECSDVS